MITKETYLFTGVFFIVTLVIYGVAIILGITPKIAEFVALSPIAVYLLGYYTVQLIKKLLRRQ